MIFREKSFIDRLCKMIRHAYGHENKENARNKPSESEIQTSIESKALEYINNNLILIINLNSLHNYYQWVSLFPNLEKLCSTRFINQTCKDKQTFEGKSVSMLTDRTDVTSYCNFLEKFIKDFIKKNLMKSEYEDHKFEREPDYDEKVVFDIKEDPLLTVKSDHRLGTSVSTKLTNDKIQIFKDPECFNNYPHNGAISDEFYSETRFKNFIETFNKLYSLIKGKLLRSKAFNQKYKER